ncbi:MAG TPA: nicotinate-nucleotide--dimethylbenzimidazole phosphoribosyltransferase [Dehalococcoidia bacterium]|nr:nicotinate-nucleotide--dimethylbenzimidazole phosphoribosyltransferase [Dehalococcoidia bacterium]
MTISLPEIPPLDREAAAAAAARLDSLTKPRGSLGRLEELAIALAAMQGRPLPLVSRKLVLVVAADHGVVAQGVSAYPAEVTRQMVANFLAGGAAINVLSRVAGAELAVVDAGMVCPVDDPRVIGLRLGPGTHDFSRGPAMSMGTAAEALRRGVALADRFDSDVVACGEMGIGNSTAAAALAAALLGLTPAAAAGPGAGLDAAGVERKASVIARALAANRPDPANALDVLAKLGGFEVGILAGFMVGAAARRRVLLIDGVISTAAALIAARLAPVVRDYMIAAHRSPEPAHGFMLEALALTPLLDFSMRLGEGSGAALTIPILEAACRLLAEMATFDEAGVWRAVARTTEANGDGG